MGRRLLPWLLLLVLAVPGLADEKDAAPPGGMPAERELVLTLRRWLSEGTDTEAAWAAWIAGERRLTALTPQLIARLEMEAKNQKRLPFLHRVLVDALIQLRVRVPGRALVPLAGTHSVAVLLCRRPAVEPAHLEVWEAIDEDRDPVPLAWIGIGNALAGWRVPAFVARVLGEYRVERVVRVFDRDPPYPTWGRYGGGLSGGGAHEIPADYPPVALWVLSRNAQDGYTLLNRGGHPVYARRVIHEPGSGREVGWGVYQGGPNADEIRQAWLRRWLRGLAVHHYAQFDTVEVKWTGGRQVWQRLRAQVYGELHDRFREWRDALFRRGLLDRAAMGALRPLIEIELRDQRDLKRHPLPPFPEIPFEPRLPAASRERPESPDGI